MTSRTHDMAAFASLLTVAVYFPPSQLNVTSAIAALVGNVVGALAPDMDQATNRLWDLLPAGNFVGRILRNLMLHHRTLSHSILGGFLFYKILEFAAIRLFNSDFVNIKVVVISIMIGFISHLIADMFTKEGVPLFFPIPVKIGIPPIEALRITTGKFMEKFIIFPAVIVYLIWLVINKQAELLHIVKLIRT